MDNTNWYEDSTVVIALHSPFKSKLSTYRGYDVKALKQKLISVLLLKTRFGTSDIAIGTAFYGDCTIYKELPTGEEITDYEKYADPSWTLVQAEPEDRNKSVTFTL